MIFTAVFFIAISILSLLKSMKMDEPLTYYLETVFYPVIIDTIIGFCIGIGTFIVDMYLPFKEKNQQ